jgi:hypothetical protein
MTASVIHAAHSGSHFEKKFKTYFEDNPKGQICVARIK